MRAELSILINNSTSLYVLLHHHNQNKTAHLSHHGCAVFNCCNNVSRLREPKFLIKRSASTHLNGHHLDESWLLLNYFLAQTSCNVQARCLTNTLFIIGRQWNLNLADRVKSQFGWPSNEKACLEQPRKLPICQISQPACVGDEIDVVIHTEMYN